MPSPEWASRAKARCDGCGTALWALRRGEWTLRSGILRLTDDGFVARCPKSGCKADVPIPFIVSDPSAVPVTPPAAGRRYVLRLDRSDGTGSM